MLWEAWGKLLTFFISVLVYVFGFVVNLNWHFVSSFRVFVGC